MKWNYRSEYYKLDPPDGNASWTGTFAPFSCQGKCVKKYIGALEKHSSSWSSVTSYNFNATRS